LQPLRNRLLSIDSEDSTAIQIVMENEIEWQQTTRFLLL
jgi:hypothetical protein